ncbi:MAG TPA: heat-inducible transcriptional repressor HrcA [Actinomycetota bacterium]|nr:heat-inducible transcriptional repressor HrcA [Actinomycetota bacterium]
MGLDERKARLLRAVVREFIQTAEPVGSKALAGRYSLGISPATIRNELAALEDQGFLSHPHTSAGRVPTDRGYRFYVDSLSGVGELARAQRDAVMRYLEGAAGLEETLQRTSLLLASLTHYTAMVAPPALDRSRVRHVELVQLGSHVIMLVLIVDTGRVEQRLIETRGEVHLEDLEDLRRRLNEKLAGEQLNRAELVLSGMLETVPTEQRWLFTVVADVLGQVVSDRASDRVWLGGQAHIVGPGAFDELETVRQVYELLEQQVLVLRLLQMTFNRGAQQISVVIGSENQMEGMQSCSLVTSTYPAGDTIGSIGVLGPTRMDYLRAMAAVQAVASYLGSLLDDVER